MPQIVQPSDFSSGRLRIPNAVSLNAGEGVNGDLVALIAECEERVLLGALGQTQYDAFQTALGQDPVPAPWLDVKTLVAPMLQNYIYCQWLRYNEVDFTTVGGGKGQAKGQTVADLNAKYVEAWNRFVLLYSGEDEFKTSLYEHLRDTAGLDESEFMFEYNFENQFGL